MLQVKRSCPEGGCNLTSSELFGNIICLAEDESVMHINSESLPARRFPGLAETETTHLHVPGDGRAVPYINDLINIEGHPIKSETGTTHLHLPGDGSAVLIY